MEWGDPMAGAQLQHLQREHALRRKPDLHEMEKQPGLAVKQRGIVGLQRLVGNQAVQRLIAQGKLSSHGFAQRKPAIQRCSCGGTCAACKGQEEELPVSASLGSQVQRFWGDEEEEEDGGSWWDSATEEVGSWFSDDETESGGGYSESEDSGSSSVFHETLHNTGMPGYSEGEQSEGDGGSSWWDDVGDWASDTWNDWTGGGEQDTEEEELIDDNTGGQPGTPGHIPTVSADCLTEEGVGFGNGGGTINLHGRTDANFNHGRPIPAPFPDTVTVTTRSTPAGNAFDAVGSFDVTFDANTSVTLPPVPSGLTPCQEEAVRNFINGPLAAHEQDHVNAFRSNYDGTFTASVNVHNIADTSTNRQNAMQNPVNAEDVTRVTAANNASNALDPWNQTIPGLDCEDESEDSEDSE
jgi:hypothetical protein